MRQHEDCSGSVLRPRPSLYLRVSALHGEPASDRVSQTVNDGVAEVELRCVKILCKRKDDMADACVTGLKAQIICYGQKV